MVNIKINMNRGRLLNSNLLCNSDRLKVVNWSNLSIDKKSYHTKVDKNIKNMFNISFFFIFILFLLSFVSFIVYLYNFNLLIYCLEQCLFILFFFFLIFFFLFDFNFF